MEKRFYKELWGLRFQKMLRLEKKSVAEYQALLDESKRRFKNHAIDTYLERLINDEKKHVHLVEELIRILARQSE